LAKATIFFLKRLLYPRATKIIAVSIGVAQDLHAHLGQELEVEVIYNPIDVDRIQEMASVSLPSVNFDRYIIGVGRLTVQKGFDLLIEAFAKIPDKTIHLLLLGEGPEEVVLKKLCLALGVQDRVHFLGFVNNPYVWMAHAQCFVLSSRWEGFGLVVAEALACDTSVVATNCVAGPSEILDNGRYGLLVEPENARALTQAICDVLAGKRFENPTIKLEEFRAERVAAHYAQIIFEAKLIS
jgi:GalNAc-alpha-(1->4)-GalNAc-alpha-(1->3)-diNAcBac-PP-undecaprenol alpha-1,4-N-acetyl-D-galactosaminyltransferase